MLESIQCSMCKAVLESGADEKTAESLNDGIIYLCLLYTSPSPRDATLSRMPSSA